MLVYVVDVWRDNIFKGVTSLTPVESFSKDLREIMIIIKQDIDEILNKQL